MYRCMPVCMYWCAGKNTIHQTFLRREINKGANLPLKGWEKKEKFSKMKKDKTEQRDQSEEKKQNSFEQTKFRISGELVEI